MSLGLWDDQTIPLWLHYNTTLKTKTKQWTLDFTPEKDSHITDQVEHDKDSLEKSKREKSNTNRNLVIMKNHNEIMILNITKKHLIQLPVISRCKSNFIKAIIHTYWGCLGCWRCLKIPLIIPGIHDVFWVGLIHVHVLLRYWLLIRQYQK